MQIWSIKRIVRISVEFQNSDDTEQSSVNHVVVQDIVDRFSVYGAVDSDQSWYVCTSTDTIAATNRQNQQW